MKRAIIYSTVHCKYCKYVKKFFDNIKYPYEVKNVDKDPKALEEMKTHTSKMAVPTVVVGDQVFVGFDKKVYEEYFTKEGYLYTSDGFLDIDINE